MRPESIVSFERFYLGGVVVGLVNTMLTWGDMQAELASDPAIAEAGWGTGFMVASVAFTFLIQLLFWYLIARRGSNIAKWVMTVLFVLGLVFTVPMLMGMAPMPGGTTALVLSLAITILQGIAIYFLFRPDAVAWLKGETKVDPGTFN